MAFQRWEKKTRLLRTSQSQTPWAEPSRANSQRCSDCGPDQELAELVSNVAEANNFVGVEYAPNDEATNPAGYPTEQAETSDLMALRSPSGHHLIPCACHSPTAGTAFQFYRKRPHVTQPLS